MNLKNLVLENEINELTILLLIEYMDIVSDNYLNENVSSDCKYKPGKITKPDGSIGTSKGLPGITDIVINKIQDEKTLKKLLDKVAAKDYILKDANKCLKAIKDRFQKLQRDKQIEDNLGATCDISAFNKILNAIKKIIKEFIPKAKKLGHVVNFHEAFTPDELLVAIPSIILLNEKRQVNLDNFISDSLTVIISEMNLLLNEATECDLAKLSKYIVTLRGIHKQVGDLLSDQDNKQLKKAIKEFTAHYNDFSKN